MSDATPPSEPDRQPPLPFEDAPQVEPVLVPEPLAAPVADPPTLTLDTSDESATAALYRAAIGPVGVKRYAAVFAGFEARDRAGPHWNWAACLCTLGWMLFWRMTGAALAYVGVLVAVGLIGAVLVGLVMDVPGEVRLGVAATLALLAFVVPGLWGDAWLFTHTRRRMAQALAQSSDWKAAVALLEGEAVGRSRAGWLALGYVLVAAAAAALYLLLPGVTAPTSVPPTAAPAPARAASAPSRAVATAPQVSGASAPAAGASAPVQAASTVPAPAMSAPVPAASAVMPSPAVAAAPVLSVNAPLAPMGASSQPNAAAAPAAVPASAARTGAPQPAGDSQLAQAPKAATMDKAGKADMAVHAGKAAKAVKPVKPVRQDKAEKPAKKSSASPAAAGEGRYQINVGLFAVDANAQGAYAKLRGAGLPASLQELETANGRRLRVRAGPFGTRAQADAAAAKIRALGLDAVVVRPGAPTGR